MHVLNKWMYFTFWQGYLSSFTAFDIVDFSLHLATLIFPSIFLSFFFTFSPTSTSVYPFEDSPGLLASFIISLYILFLVNSSHALWFHYCLPVDESQVYTCPTALDLGICLGSWRECCHTLFFSANLLCYCSLPWLMRHSLIQARNGGVILELPLSHCSHPVVHWVLSIFSTFILHMLSMSCVLAEASMGASSWTIELVTWLVWLSPSQAILHTVGCLQNAAVIPFSSASTLWPRTLGMASSDSWGLLWPMVIWAAHIILSLNSIA